MALFMGSAFGISDCLWESDEITKSMGKVPLRLQVDTVLEHKVDIGWFLCGGWI